MEPFKKTSFVHQDIGEHEHEMTIYDLGETYAVCNKCGKHDWSTPEGYKGDGGLVPYFKEKYQKAKVIKHEDL